MISGQALQDRLAQLMADPLNNSLVGQMKQQIVELGTEGQTLLRSVSSLISMPSEMKWKEQRQTALETAMKAIESMAEGEARGLFGLFRKKEGLVSGQTELEGIIRELQRFRESMKNDGVTLRFELEGIQKQIALMEETLAVIASVKTGIISIKEKMNETDFRALSELLERKHENYSASQLATLQTRAALELLIRNNELLLDNLNNILSVLPDISQLGFIISRLRSGDTSEISQYRSNLKQAMKSLN